MQLQLTDDQLAGRSVGQTRKLAIDYLAPKSLCCTARVCWKLKAILLGVKCIVVAIVVLPPCTQPATSGRLRGQHCLPSGESI